LRLGNVEPMLISRKPVDKEAGRMKLDTLAVGLQREAEGAEVDPFDVAILSATFGLIELSKTHSDALGQLQKSVNKLARRL
jgi:hypothetical protein